MSGLIGKKIGMTSIFTETGENVACTVIEAGPCIVSQVKTMEKDGYEAIQLAFDDRDEKRTSKPLIGHFKKIKSSPKSKIVEFTKFEEKKQPGDILNVNLFVEGEYIDVVGISKGKGFQGVIKRHNFSGVGDNTHGQHNRLRAPGSMGASSYPSRVFKGTRMAGRMGSDRVKIINVKVLNIFPEKNIMIVKGSIPGNNGSYLIIERWN